jgi:hypothetical protein
VLAALLELVPLVIDLEDDGLLGPNDWPCHLYVEIRLAAANWDGRSRRWVCRADRAVNEAVLRSCALRNSSVIISLFP